jgi:hypothetical protein
MTLVAKIKINNEIKNLRWKSTRIDGHEAALFL